MWMKGFGCTILEIINFSQPSTSSAQFTTTKPNEGGLAVGIKYLSIYWIDILKPAVVSNSIQ